MAPAVIAGLVREQSPDHATHTPHEFLRTVSSDAVQDVIEVRCCSPCTVGLTLKVPRTPPPGEVIASFTVEKDGKVTDHLKAPKAEKGKVGDGGV